METCQKIKAPVVNIGRRKHIHSQMLTLLIKYFDERWDGSDLVTFCTAGWHIESFSVREVVELAVERMEGVVYYFLDR